MTLAYMRDDSMQDYLLSLSEAEFRDIVNRDLRKQATPSEAAALRSPEVVGRFYGSLVATSKNVEGQLSTARQDWRATKARLQRKIGDNIDPLEHKRLQREWAESEERFASTRVGILRFKSGLDEWIVAARTIKLAIEDQNNSRLAELEQAIIDHQTSFPGEDEPSFADEQLWKLIS